MFRDSVNILRSFSATLLLIPLATFSAQSQQVTGTPGLPGATTTITGQAASAAATEIRWRHQG
jgi:hypothetical protein